ncbi:MAG: hypothetical protein QME96_17525, partial [Myxococcota bacterium]|nr:hypothetical protein [Myxococcota bacterium]
MRVRFRLFASFLFGTAAALVVACSLIYPFDLPSDPADAGDADSVNGDADADSVDGDADADSVDGDGDAGEAEASVCGNGVLESGEECDSPEPSSCVTGCGESGARRCVDCALGPCLAPAESCNGCDDDGDTETDEGCPCADRWAIEHPAAPGLETLSSVSVAPDGTAFAVGREGTILRYDGGRWTPVAHGMSYNLKWVHALSSTWAVAVGMSGASMFLRDGRWEYVPTGTTGMLYGVSAVAEDDVYAGGANGTIVRFDGTGWTPMPSGTTRHVYRVWAAGRNDVYGVGTAGTVLHYDGTSWTTLAVPPWLGAIEVQSVWSDASDPGTVYVVGSDGVIGRWSGGTWTLMASGTIQTIYSLWGSAPDDIWGVGGRGNGGTIVHFDGGAWRVVLDASRGAFGAPSIDRQGFQAVSGSSRDNVFAAARDGGILRYDGTSWRPTPGAATVSLRGIGGVSPRHVFAVGTAGS